MATVLCSLHVTFDGFSTVSSHRAYILKKRCDFVVRVEPPLRVGGCLPDIRNISEKP